MSCARLLSLLFVIATLPACLTAESATTPRAVYEQRALKIATSLKLADAEKSNRVATLIADQYQALAKIHAVRDEKIKAAKTAPGSDKSAINAGVDAVRTEATRAQNELHVTYLSKLAQELSAAEIDQVKDGMTYGVLPLTFRVYQEMLPNLTQTQKDQIYAWLVEAREQAMDASTSEEKHGWFGKYKGRINNYLSAAGIDMKQAERDRAARKQTTPKS